MIKLVRPMPEAIAETASFLTPVEQARLWEAAVTLADSRGAVMRVTALFGRRIESWRAKLTHTGDRFGGPAWTNLTRRTRDAVEDTLWSGYDMATAGLMATPRLVRPSRPRGNPMHKIAATASGLASGFVGLPGVMFDIPFTTTTILRAIMARMSAPRKPSAPAWRCWRSAVPARSMTRPRSAIGRRGSARTT
jgi:hypothetical protein